MVRQRLSITQNPTGLAGVPEALRLKYADAVVNGWTPARPMISPFPSPLKNEALDLRKSEIAERDAADQRKQQLLLDTAASQMAGSHNAIEPNYLAVGPTNSPAFGRGLPGTDFLAIEAAQEQAVERALSKAEAQKREERRKERRRAIAGALT